MAQVHTPDTMPYFLTLTFTLHPFQICLPWSWDDLATPELIINNTKSIDKNMDLFPKSVYASLIVPLLLQLGHIPILEVIVDA